MFLQAAEWSPPAVSNCLRFEGIPPAFWIHCWPHLQAHAVQEQVKLYDVDVTCSRYLLRPEVLRAAHFAALAHEGQVCLTGSYMFMT